MFMKIVTHTVKRFIMITSCFNFTLKQATGLQ